MKSQCGQPAAKKRLAVDIQDIDIPAIRNHHSW
jgi:hypothetical protein